MPKQKQRLVQSIYKEIEKHKKGQTIVGNPNTLNLMKKGDISPTVKSIAKMLYENGMSACLTVEYAGTTTTLDFSNFTADFLPANKKE